MRTRRVYYRNTEMSTHRRGAIFLFFSHFCKFFTLLHPVGVNRSFVCSGRRGGCKPGQNLHKKKSCLFCSLSRKKAAGCYFHYSIRLTISRIIYKLGSFFGGNSRSRLTVVWNAGQFRQPFRPKTPLPAYFSASSIYSFAVFSSSLMSGSESPSKKPSRSSLST